MRLLDNWLVWCGGGSWGYTPTSFFGHRITFYGWGMDVKWFGWWFTFGWFSGHRGGRAFWIHKSRNGTPAQAVWEVGWRPWRRPYLVRGGH